MTLNIAIAITMLIGGFLLGHTLVTKTLPVKVVYKVYRGSDDGGWEIVCVPTDVKAPPIGWSETLCRR